MPTEATAMRWLTDLLGGWGANVAWARACLRASVSQPVKTLEDLERVANALATSDVPLTRVAGRSLIVRISTYRTLADRSDSVRIEPVDPGTDPLKDVERLREIAELDLESLEDDDLLDRLARQAAERLGLPIGVVTVVLDEAQYFKAMHGTSGWVAESRGTPVEWSFCRNVVRRDGDFVVENALEDEVMKDSPLVTNEGIRCYAGVPLRSSKGKVLGAFCVKGTEERHFSAEDLEVLRGLAAEAMRHIEARRDRVEA
jgi:GAF domain-containing protein